MYVAAGFALGGSAIVLAGASQQVELSARLMMVVTHGFPYVEYCVIARVARAFKTPVHLKVANTVSGICLLVTSLWLHWAVFVRSSHPSTDGLVAIPVLALQVCLLAPLGVFVTPRATPR